MSNVTYDTSYAILPWSTPGIQTWIGFRPSFFPSQLPPVGLNAYIRKLIYDSAASFTPSLFVLYPEARRAMTLRDRWIRSTWPLWKQQITPLSSDAVELERCEMQEAFRLNYNWISGVHRGFPFWRWRGGLIAPTRCNAIAPG